VVCLPLASQLPTLGASVSSGAAWMALVPPAWFLGLQRLLQGGADARLAQLAVIGIGAAALVAAIVAATYIVLFRHFERLMLRPAPTSRPWWRRERPLLETRSAPAGRGVFKFATATLGRSQLHQGVLVGLSACGVGLAIIVLTSARLTTAAMIVPFLLMFACGVAVRAALALPIEHRANWIFQVTEDLATRREEMRAVDRIVTMYVVGVPIAAAVPLWWVTLGRDALVAATAVVAIGLVFVHGVLLDWHRIPFTCSYLPGKRFIGHSALIGGAACLLFTLIATGLLRTALNGTHAGLVTVASLVVIGYWLRERRLANWGRTPLMFEDEFPDQPVQLQL